MPTEILACVDGSTYSASVCDHTAWAAARLSASVTVVHVHDRHPGESAGVDLSGNLGLGEGDALLKELTRLDEQRGRLAQQRSRLILDAATTRLRAAGISAVVPRQRHGALVDAVTELGAAVDLVVIGKRGEDVAFATRHLGSNLERVVRASHQPVLVAAPNVRPIERVLIAFDGGPSAQKAVAYVARSSLLVGTECRLLTVGGENDDAHRRLAAGAELLAGAGFATSATVRDGHPETVIAAEIEADGSDLLVMGAYGHSRIRHLVIGSTTTATLRSCPVSVLLVR